MENDALRVNAVAPLLGTANLLACIALVALGGATVFLIKKQNRPSMALHAAVRMLVIFVVLLIASTLRAVFVFCNIDVDSDSPQVSDFFFTSVIRGPLSAPIWYRFGVSTVAVEAMVWATLLWFCLTSFRAQFHSLSMSVGEMDSQADTPLMQVPQVYQEI